MANPQQGDFYCQVAAPEGKSWASRALGFGNDSWVRCHVHRFAANVSGFANVVANLWWECRAKEASFARLTRTCAIVANPRWVQDGYSMELWFNQWNQLKECELTVSQEVTLGLIEHEIVLADAKDATKSCCKTQVSRQSLSQVSAWGPSMLPIYLTSDTVAGGCN